MTELAPRNSSFALERPAAEITARIEHKQHGDIVHLPPRFARATVEFYLGKGGPFTLLDGPSTTNGLSLDRDQWAFIVPEKAAKHLGLIPRVGSVRLPDAIAFVNPRDTLFVLSTHTRYVLSALEEVKPHEVDAAGLPLPWVPPRPRHEPSAEADDDRDDDVRVLAPTDRLPLVHLPPPDDADAFIDSATIRRHFADLCETAGYSEPPELTLTRGRENRLGLVSGRVWFRVGGAPLRVHLTTCPNSDLAEVLATIVHELAHPLAHTTTGSRAHDEPMKRAMVDLASTHFGERWFETARTRISGPVRALDYWLASSIRAALRSNDIPRPKSTDDTQLARTLGKLKKLRELANNQLGRPEGIAATATANDLVTHYDLGSYGVGLPEIDDEQLVDRWVKLHDNAVWRRLLAHGVAAHFGVFSLAINNTLHMHFFGAYADVIAAEYLYSVSAARITRECEAHIAAWKKVRGKTTSAETRVEKTSFCDCAVIEFRKKLKHIADEDSADTEDTLEEAEEFARVEHEKRGRGWASARKKLYRENAAGRAAGRAMEVLHGVSGQGPAAALPHRR